jgi:hypothetical protein
MWIYDKTHSTTPILIFKIKLLTIQSSLCCDWAKQGLCYTTWRAEVKRILEILYNFKIRKSTCYSPIRFLLSTLTPSSFLPHSAPNFCTTGLQHLRRPHACRSPTISVCQPRVPRTVDPCRYPAKNFESIQLHSFLQNVDIGCEKCWKWYIFSKMLNWM